MLKSATSCVIGLLCGLLAVTPAAAQDKERAAVDKLFAPWTRDDSPGCALAVIRDGNIVHKRGYGMADLEHGIAIGPDTVFNIASVSKQFTVFLILLLAHAGLLSLDDDVRRHVPDLPDFGKVIKVRHLIHHTSGLREDWSLLTLAGWRTEDVILREDVFNLVRRQKQLNFTPGDDYLYCNTGYHLLAQIVQKVSKQSLRDFAQEKLFGPLGMKQTVFQDDHRQIIKGRAASYAPGKKGGFERVLYAAGRAGPGNLHTTIEDLARWDANFYSPKIGTPKLIEDMLRRAVLNNGKQIDYAGGLRLGTYRGQHIVEHSGVIAGYRSVLLRFPRQRFSVILLANVSSFNPAAMARRVADIHLRDDLQPVKKASEDVPVETLVACAGEYRFDAGFVLDFRAADKALFLNSDAAKIRLTPTGPGVFTDAGSGTTYSFAEAERTGSVVLRGIGLDQIGRKAKRPALADVDNRHFLGAYHSEELDVTFHVIERDGRLFVRHRKGTVQLDPLAPDEFSTPAGSLFTMIRFSRGNGKAIDGFSVYTARARDLRFVKLAALREP